MGENRLRGGGKKGPRAPRPPIPEGLEQISILFALGGWGRSLD